MSVYYGGMGRVTGAEDQITLGPITILRKYGGLMSADVGSGGPYDELHVNRELYPPSSRLWLP